MKFETVADQLTYDKLAAQLHGLESVNHRLSLLAELGTVCMESSTEFLEASVRAEVAYINRTLSMEALVIGDTFSMESILGSAANLARRVAKGVADLLRRIWAFLTGLFTRNKKTAEEEQAKRKSARDVLDEAFKRSDKTIEEYGLRPGSVIPADKKAQIDAAKAFVMVSSSGLVLTKDLFESDLRIAMSTASQKEAIADGIGLDHSMAVKQFQEMQETLARMAGLGINDPLRNYQSRILNVTSDADFNWLLTNRAQEMEGEVRRVQEYLGTPVSTTKLRPFPSGLRFGRARVTMRVKGVGALLLPEVAINTDSAKWKPLGSSTNIPSKGKMERLDLETARQIEDTITAVIGLQEKVRADMEQQGTIGNKVGTDNGESLVHAQEKLTEFGKNNKQALEELTTELKSFATLHKTALDNFRAIETGISYHNMLASRYIGPPFFDLIESAKLKEFGFEMDNDGGLIR